jgi:Ca2+/Na+ antiporter
MSSHHFIVPATVISMAMVLLAVVFIEQTKADEAIGRYIYIYIYIYYEGEEFICHIAI